LRSMNGGKIHGTVIPNGVGIPDALKKEPAESGLGSNEILFCGSLDYLPNREGLSWFCRHIFPLVLNRMPAAKLLVVGKGDPGEELGELLKNRSIVNYGMVDRVDVYYKKAAMAIVPLLSGSGTRLKLLESMAHRVPVVSTGSGAEGINYTDGKNILIADGAELFARRVVEMLDNPPLARQISQEAFRFVQNEYDWNIVGKKMFDYLSGLN
jgi:glycosyltransferase involved in cell wall biosynthesis